MATENGWEPSHAPADLLEWRTIPGTNPKVSLQFMKGWPSTILTAYAADYHAYIEPLRDRDSASFTLTNSVATSNHLNGTAMDLNWDSHPFRVNYAGFDDAKIKRMRSLLEFYNFEGLQIVFWAQDWTNPKDAMHHQMGYSTWNNPKVLRFINERIRPDGFSTYQRGGVVTPPVVSPPVTNPPVVTPPAVDVLVRATGISVEKASQILVGIQNGLRDSNCINVKRIAMWLAQMGHESAGFNATEEYASGAAYEGRGDLGNTQPGDGVRFKGRSWIQITGRSNYARLSKWAFEQNLVDSPTFFVDAPTKLAQYQYAGLGPAWYWTVARSDINALSDAGDLVTVTKRINGGTNGLDDRKNRYNRALALGDQLLALISTAPSAPGDDMAQVPQDQWDRVFREITDLRASRSPLRHIGEGKIDTWSGFGLNSDGHGHVQLVKLLAGYGHPETLALLREIATADPAQYPDRQSDIKLAQAILAEATAPAAAPVSAFTTAPTQDFQPFYPTIGSFAATTTTVDGDSTGALIGRAYDALEALKAAQGALSPEAKASVDSLINVLKTEGASE